MIDDCEEYADAPDCPGCDGDGYLKVEVLEPCEFCDGSGEDHDGEDCWACDGSGQQGVSDADDCDLCGGDGVAVCRLDYHPAATGMGESCGS